MSIANNTSAANSGGAPGERGATTAAPLVRAVALTREFRIGTGPFGKSRVLRAVDAVDLQIAPGRTLGIVGESGCGKTTLGRLLLRLLEPTSGRVEFDGVDLASLDPRALRAARRHMQIVFQDPYASLNPRMRVGRSVGEGLEAHGLASGAELRARGEELLDRVGLGKDAYDRYPHEFSGGQRQRIGIARALALSPRFIVADEPVSALDVSVGAQILNLLMDIQERQGVAFAFISHDLRVVEHISHDMAVMYLGRIVEAAPSARIYAAPQHPYTQALLSAVPTVEGKDRKKRIVLGGDVPSPLDPPSGCVFHPRCPIAVDRCRTEVPKLVDRGGHKTACHLVD